MRIKKTAEIEVFPIENVSLYSLRQAAEHPIGTGRKKLAARSANQLAKGCCREMIQNLKRNVAGRTGRSGS